MTAPPLPASAGRPNVAIVIPAAGRASRMGDPNRHKLLALFDGLPLVRRVAHRALASRASSVTVVTGFQRDAITAALSGLPLSVVHNPRYAEGLGASLAAGFSAPSLGDTDGVLILLADMPSIDDAHINRLIEAFGLSGGKSVAQATSNDLPGHPIILPKVLYPAMMSLSGDSGARKIIEGSGLPIVSVEIGLAARHDVDTVDMLIKSGGVFSESIAADPLE